MDQTSDHQNKQVQINALASLVPQIMNAMGGGDQRTTQLLERQRVNNQTNMERMQLRNFMRSVMSPSSGDITPDLIMEQAALFGVDPVKAIEIVQAFGQHRDSVAKKQSDEKALGLGRKLLSGELTRENVLRNPEYTDRIAMGAVGMMPQPDDRSFGWIGRADGSKIYGELTPGTVSMPAPKTGMEITTSDGTVLRTGVPVQGNTRATTNKIQEKILNTGNALSRLQSVQNAFFGDMQTLGGKFIFEKIKLKEKFGQDLSSEDKDYLEKASAHYVTAFSHLNATLNELSGAAVNAQEDVRLRAQMPNPGKEGILGLLSGDSKTQFEDKIKKAIQLQRLALARYNYILQHGFKIKRKPDGTPLAFLGKDGKPIELDSVPELMNTRGAELMQLIKEHTPGISDEEAEKITEKQLAKEFGLGV